MSIRPSATLATTLPASAQPAPEYKARRGIRSSKVERLEARRITSATPQQFPYSFEIPKREKVSHYRDECEISIDVEALVWEVMRRAVRAKSGKAKLLGGRITATRVKHELDEVRERDVPVPNGYIEVPAE